MRNLILLLALPVLTGCGVSDRGTSCGIVALAGPTMLLEEFTKAGHTLGAIPEKMPEILPVRMAVGAAQRALVGRTDSSWVVGVDGPFPEKPVPGFGVLLVDQTQGPQGVLLYEGKPIPGAPVLGTVHVGTRVIPMIALQTGIAGFQDARCPIFPDSLKR
jgi:hypothetical protein